MPHIVNKLQKRSLVSILHTVQTLCGMWPRGHLPFCLTCWVINAMTYNMLNKCFDLFKIKIFFQIAFWSQWACDKWRDGIKWSTATTKIMILSAMTRKHDPKISCIEQSSHFVVPMSEWGEPIMAWIKILSWACMGMMIKNSSIIIGNKLSNRLKKVIWKALCR